MLNVSISPAGWRTKGCGESILADRSMRVAIRRLRDLKMLLVVDDVGAGCEHSQARCPVLAFLGESNGTKLMRRAKLPPSQSLGQTFLSGRTRSTTRSVESEKLFRADTRRHGYAGACGEMCW